jgi:hypothetical protein
MRTNDVKREVMVAKEYQRIRSRYTLITALP